MLRANSSYLLALRAFCTCCISACRSSGVVTYNLVLLVDVQTTDRLCTGNGER